MMPELRFDNANNGCHSLRVMAELVRRGEATVIVGETKDGITSIKVQWPQERPR